MKRELSGNKSSNVVKDIGAITNLLYFQEKLKESEE